MLNTLLAPCVEAACGAHVLDDDNIALLALYTFFAVNTYTNDVEAVSCHDDQENVVLR